MYGGGAPQQGGGGSDDAALMAALAMAAAQEEAKKKKTAYMEAALPVALLVILALIFAVKLGFINLGFLPMFNQPVNVLLLTDDPTATSIQNTLKVLQKEASYYKIKVRVLSLSPNKRIYAQQLADADVVILYEVKDKPVLSLIQRREVAKYLKAGGKMIVVLNSGTYVPQCDVLGVNCNPNAEIWVGWLELKDFMPVDCSDEASCQPETAQKADLYTIDPEHPIMRGFEEVDLGDGVRAIKQLQLSKNGVDIADIYEGGIDNPTAVYPGITVTSGILGTKVIHFNYDPWITRDIFIQAILYLAGRTE